MKFVSVALTFALLSSGLAMAAPGTSDVPHVSSPASIQEVVRVDDSSLDVTLGGFNRPACFGIAIGVALGALAAGPITGIIAISLGGAFAPAVGTLLCSR